MDHFRTWVRNGFAGFWELGSTLFFIALILIAGYRFFQELFNA